MVPVTHVRLMPQAAAPVQPVERVVRQTMRSSGANRDSELRACLFALTQQFGGGLKEFAKARRRCPARLNCRAD